MAIIKVYDQSRPFASCMNPLTRWPAIAAKRRWFAPSQP